jgi:hypothetical protein
MNLGGSAPVCSRCGAALVKREPQFGVPYWACETPHDPPEVAPIDRDPEYAIALIRSRLVDPLDKARLDPFDIDGDAVPIPGRFVDAVCERLAVCVESDRDRERDRVQESIESRSNSTTTPDQQRGLSEWS